MIKINKLFKKNEDGSVSTGFMIIFFSVLLLVMGIALDYTNAINQRTIRIEAANSAVQIGAQNIRSDGSLTKKSVASAINAIDKNGEVNLGVKSNEIAAGSSSICSKATINGVERNLPYFEVALDINSKSGTGTTSANAAKWTWSGTPGTATVDNIGPGTNYQENQKYKVIEMTVYSASKFYWWGMVTGDNCQLHAAKVSAFISGSDTTEGRS